MLRLTIRWALLALIATALTVPAWGQQDRRASREREALRRAQQQVQQASKDLAALQERFAATDRERALLNDQLRGARTRVRNAEARNQQLQRELEALTAERDALRTQRNEQDQRLQESAARVAQLERDLATALQRSRQLDAQAALQRDAITACEDRNAKLYDTGRALIDECRDRSATDRVLRLEPFTGIRRVAIENALEAYRDRLDEQKQPAVTQGAR